MKTRLTLLVLSLPVAMIVLALVVTPVQAESYSPMGLIYSRPVLAGTYTTRFTQSELYEAFYQGYIAARIPADQAAARAAELSEMFAGTIAWTLTDTGALYSRNLGAQSAIGGAGEYRFNSGRLIVQDENKSTGVYLWRMAGRDLLSLEVVNDPDPVRVVVLTLHPWIRQ